MDEEQLKALIHNFTMKGEKAGGEEDYKDFLNHYMNAVNHNADDEQLQAMMASVSPARRQGMQDYDRTTKMHSNPTVELERMGLGNLLRGGK